MSLLVPTAPIPWKRPGAPASLHTHNSYSRVGLGPDVLARPPCPVHFFLIYAEFLWGPPSEAHSLAIHCLLFSYTQTNKRVRTMHVTGPARFILWSS
jgi:hypothetical protein